MENYIASHLLIGFVLSVFTFYMEEHFTTLGELILCVAIGLVLGWVLLLVYAIFGLVTLLSPVFDVVIKKK